MGSITRLAQGIVPLEKLVHAPHLRLHSSRVLCLERRKNISCNVSIRGKPELQWRSGRASVGCRAAAADAAGAGSEKEVAVKNGGMKGMAEAFDISPRTAFGITAAIAMAALVLPMYMPSSGIGTSLKVRGLHYLTLLLGFYMAWNIGANDVANAMGTSVGSGALTLRQAVMTAAVLEFAGAFMVGSHVSHTMQSGILTAKVFAGRETLLFCGMLSSLGAAGTWLQVGTQSSQIMPILSQAMTI